MIGAIAGTALGAVGSILGGISASEAAAKRNRYLETKAQENKNWYDRRYNEDATQRADAQRLLSMTEDAIRKRNRAAQGREAVMGGPTENSAREKEANNKIMTDAVSQINAAGEKRKEQIEQQYEQRKDAIQDAKMQVEAQRAAAIGDATKGALGAAGNIATLFDKK